MSERIPSTTTYVEQGVERRYSTQSGWQTVRRFKGTQSAIESLAADLVNFGYDVSISEGPEWQLEATVGYDTDGGVEQPIDQWELMASAVEKDLLSADVESVNSIVPADIEILRTVIDGTSLSAAPSWTSTTTAIPNNLYLLVKSGVKSAVVYAPVLKHTKTVSRAYEIPASLTNVGSVISSSALISQESIPTNISSQFPTSGYTTKSGITNGFYKGWLKAFPVIQTSAYQKTQIVQEWHWGFWATSLYTIVA